MLIISVGSVISIEAFSKMIDELDRKLVALLRANARESIAALAKNLKVSRGTVQNRIARLLKRGVIQGFTIRSSPEHDANRIRAMMCIAIEGERSAKVVRALRGFPAVKEIYTTNGRWDLVVELNTDTLASFSQALDQLRTIEGIATTETSIFLANPR